MAIEWRNTNCLLFTALELDSVEKEERRRKKDLYQLYRNLEIEKKKSQTFRENVDLNEKAVAETFCGSWE